MPRSTYGLTGSKIDSPGKEAARGFFYSQLSRRDFLTKHHILIASREVGDVKYLLRWGVRARNIIACDIDDQAVCNARKLGVRALPYSIQDTVGWYLDRYGSKNLASISVDLCWTINYGAPVLNEVLGRLYFRVPDRVLVGFTFCRSRYSLPPYASTYASAINFHLIHTNRTADDGRSFHYQSWTRSSVGSPMTITTL